MKRYVSVTDIDNWYANGAPVGCTIRDVPCSIVERFGPGLYENNIGWSKVDVTKPTEQDVEQLAKAAPELHTVINFVTEAVMSTPVKDREWLRYQKRIGANAAVAKFINDFRAQLGSDGTNNLIRYYGGKHSYYFACLLKTVFNRGETVCVKGEQHIVWMDYDGYTYDINGRRTKQFEIYTLYFDVDKFRCAPEDTWEDIGV